MGEHQTTSIIHRLAAAPVRVLLAALIAALIGVGAHAFLAGRDDAEYIFASVNVGDIEDLVTATGTLRPRDAVEVGAQVSGQIDKIYVEVGDVVAQGDLLAEIDPTTSEARVEANRASLRSSEIGLQTQRNNLVKAERDYQRLKNLFAEDATTREQLINAETSLENARNQIVQSQAQIEQQKANMRVEETTLRYTRIAAPIDGTVMNIEVSEGQSINASQTAPTVLSLANLGTMEVLADVSEADVGKLRKGMKVYFSTLGAGEHRRWYGELKRIEPTPKAQQSVVLYPALFDVDNEDGSLMPSMTAQVFFVVAEARGVVMLPMAALQHGQRIAGELAGSRGGGGLPVPVANAGTATGANARNTKVASRPAGQDGMPVPVVEQAGQMGFMPGQHGGPQAAGAAGAAGMQAPRSRPGTVIVRKPDGRLEPRRVVIGVTNRVHGQVLEGLEEGEEVVVARRDEQAERAKENRSNGQENMRRQRFPGRFF